MRIIDVQIEEFLTNCQIKRLSTKTIKSYSQTLLLMANFLEDRYGITDAQKVKVQYISAYIAYLEERGKYTVVSDIKSKQSNFPDNRTDYNKQISKTTINNYIRNMRVFFNYLVEFDYIIKSPMNKVKPLKNDRTPLDFVTDEQFKNLLKHMNIALFHEYRDKVILQLLLDTGMRIGECLAIQITDLDFLHNSITLPWENTKGKKTRTVFFCDNMRRILRTWIRHKDNYTESNLLFTSIRGNKLSINSFERNVRQYGARVGLQNITPKVFRNNFAKRFLMNGGDIFTLSKILGHSDVTVTEKAYLDLTDDDLRVRYQRYSPLANLRK